MGYTSPARHGTSKPQMAPAGILREPFYKIFQKFGPCGHIKRTLLQNIQKIWPLRAYEGSPFTKYSQIVAPAGI